MSSQKDFLRRGNLPGAVQTKGINPYNNSLIECSSYPPHYHHRGLLDIGWSCLVDYSSRLVCCRMNSVERRASVTDMMVMQLLLTNQEACVGSASSVRSDQPMTCHVELAAQGSCKVP